MTNQVIPSPMDVEHIQIIRTNVTKFMQYVAATYTLPTQVGRLLDIAPQDHAGARPFFPATILVETLDIDPNANCTYHGDICAYNSFLDADTFDFIVCTEVLEHTLQPFAAADEIWRLLKPEGYLFISVPFNFRIHGPLPDCWRFTEHGLRALLHRFTIREINEIATPERPLMPIHYTVVAQKPALTASLE